MLLLILLLTMAELAGCDPKKRVENNRENNAYANNHIVKLINFSPLLKWWIKRFLVFVDAQIVRII